MFRITRIIVLLFLFFSISLICAGRNLILTVTYNNVPFREDLTTAWGISVFVEGLEESILFDTGGDGSILLANLKKLGINPDEIETVVLSHIHADHVEGLDAFLKKNREVSVYLPSSFPADFKNRIKKKAKEVIPIEKPRKICNNVWTTGELNSTSKEQSLVIDTPKGLVVITGCAHPGVVNIVKFAKALLEKPIYLVLGGFHLISCSEKETREIIRQLKDLNVKKIAPSHCTGERQIEMFKEAWGKDFIDFGCGTSLKISLDNE